MKKTTSVPNRARIALAALLAAVLIALMAAPGLALKWNVLHPEVAIAAPTSQFQEKAAEFKIEANFAYLPASSIDDTKAKSIVVTDVLDAGLNASQAAMQVLGPDGSDVTSNWTCAVSGQTVTFTCKNTALAQGKHSFYINVPLKNQAMSSFKAKNGEYYVSNKATVKVNDTSSTTNEVETIIDSATLAITKAVSYEQVVGDEATYTITVKNTRADSIARNVVVTDTFDKADFALVANSLDVSGVPASVTHGIVSGHAATTKSFNNNVTKSMNGNAINVTIPYLPYGSTATITFKGNCNAAFNGKEAFNTAKATFANPAPGSASEVNAKESLWVNSAQLNLTKVADKFEYSVGDKATYTLSLSNTVPGTIAKNVFVSDSAMNARVAVDPSSITVNGVPNPVTYNIDGNGTHAEESRANAHTLTPVGNGFELIIPYLPYGKVVTITYQGECTADSNGLETMNVATAACDNPLPGTSPVEAKDSIWTNDAVLVLNKEVDDYETQVGDTVHYTVRFFNAQAGTIANNISLADLTLPEGMVLDHNSIAVNGVPTSVNYPIDSNGAGNAFDLRSNNSSIVPSGNGFTLLVDYLDAGNVITVEYDAVPQDGLNGDLVTNTARLSADNALDDEELEASADVWINSPELTIDKMVKDKKREYNIGDVVTYRIQIDNVIPGTVAWNAAMTDVFNLKGMELIRGSMVAFDAAGTELSGYERGQNMNNANFGINTNEALVCTGENYTHWQDAVPSDGGSLNPNNIKQQKRIYVEFQAIVNSELLAGEDVINTAKAWADNAPDVSDTEDIFIHEFVPEPPIVLGDTITTYKRSEPAPNALVRPGQTITYFLDVKNTGESAQPYTLVRDYIPAGTTYEDGSVSDGGVYIPVDAEGNVYGKAYVEYRLDNIEVGETRTVSFAVVVDDPAPKRIFNHALTSKLDREVTPGDPTNPEPTNPSNEVRHKTRDNAELGPILEVIKSSEPVHGTGVNPGDEITYTLQVKNSGDTRALKVGVYDAIPAHTRYVSHEVAYGGALSADSSSMGWLIPKLDPGESVELSFVVKVSDSIDEGTIIRNQASYAGNCENLPSAPLENTSNIVEHPLPEAVVSAEKSANPEADSVVHPGDEIEYTIRVKNDSNVDALDVAVFDEIPYGTTVKQINSMYQAAISEDGSGIGWYVGEIEAGKYVDLVFVVTVNDDVTEEDTIVNMATIGKSAGVPSEPLPTPTNEVEHPIVLDKPEIEAVKSANPETGSKVLAGSEITYKITVTNTSEFVANGVVVHDVVPEDTTFVSSDNAYRCDVADDQSSLGWFIGTLQPGERAQLSFTVRVNDDCAVGTIVKNHATYGMGKIMAPSEPLDAETNEVMHEVEPAPIVKAEKSANPASGSNVYAGDTIAYFITVENPSKEIAKGVAVFDEIPENTVFSSVDRAYKANSITDADGNTTGIGWFIGDMQPGEKATVSYKVKVAKDAKTGTKVTNTATYGTGLVQAPSAPLIAKTNEVDHEVVPTPDTATPDLPKAGATGTAPNGSATSPASGKFYDKTGNVLADYWWVFALIAFGGTGAAVYGVRAQRKSRQEDSTSM